MKEKSGELKKMDEAGYRCLRKFPSSSLIRTLLRAAHRTRGLIMAIANRGSDKLRKHGMFATYDRLPFKDVLQFVNAQVSE